MVHFISIEVKLDADLDTVWLSIDQMAQLFGRDKSVIGKHVRAIFKEGELQKNSVWAKFAYTASDGKTYQVDDYNLGGQGIVPCLCATRRTSIYKGLAILPYKCRRNCQ